MLGEPLPLCTRNGHQIHLEMLTLSQSGYRTVDWVTGLHENIFKVQGINNSNKRRLFISTNQELVFSETSPKIKDNYGHYNINQDPLPKVCFEQNDPPNRDVKKRDAPLNALVPKCFCFTSIQALNCFIEKRIDCE